MLLGKGFDYDVLNVWMSMLDFDEKLMVFVFSAEPIGSCQLVRLHNWWGRREQL